MGIIRGLFNLADEILSIPTDVLGLTNYSDKAHVREVAREKYINGEITRDEYGQIIAFLEK